MTLVDEGAKKTPNLYKDMFWDTQHIAPLYSIESAKRSVYPLVGSAANVK